MNDFVVHACEQVLRFTTANEWDDLSEKIKVQLSFNMGVVALGLGLTKEEGYSVLAHTRQGTKTIQQFHDHMRSLVTEHKIVINEKNVSKEL